MEQYVDVILPIPLEKLFTYRISKGGRTFREIKDIHRIGF
jgi:hypothetical protein